MSRDQKKRRFGLQSWLNLVLLGCILLLTVGLLLNAYYVFGRKVNSMYFDDAVDATRAAAKYQLPRNLLPPFWKVINTDEYRRIRAQADATGDGSIIREWMEGQPSPSGVWIYTETEYQSLYEFYEDTLAASMEHIIETYSINRAYVRYWADGVAYTLVDSQAGLMAIGETSFSEGPLSEYVGNVLVPPTVYRVDGKITCTACEPIVEYDDKTISGQMCVDIDMSEAIRERYWLLINSALFVVQLIVATAAACMMLTRRMVTKPLKRLSEGLWALPRRITVY